MHNQFWGLIENLYGLTIKVGQFLSPTKSVQNVLNVLLPTSATHN